MSNELPPPGWYADPVGNGGQRYWDGQAWTAASMPAKKPARSAHDDTGRTHGHPLGHAGPTTPVPPRAQPTAHSVPAWAVAPVTTSVPSNVAGMLAARISTLPRAALIGVGLLVVVGILGFGRGSGVYQVDGTFHLVDDEFLLQNDGASCSGSGGYGDIRSGLQVTVRDATGTLIASSALRSGFVEGRTCAFDFALTDVSGSDYYTFEVGRRGELTYSHDEMDAMGWHVDFELGS